MKVRLYSGDAVGIQEWGDGLVVFSPRSGATYSLDHVAGKALSCLTHEWIEGADYGAILSSTLGVDNDEIMKRYVGRLIVQFDESGIVEVDSF
jgi:hypothetical protein